MTPLAAEPSPFRGNRYRTTLELAQWHAQTHPEAAIEPHIPIVDGHHHLFGTPTDTHFYRREDLAHDLDSGHKIIGTVYVEAFSSGWRTDGPESLRSVGEVDMICQASANPVQLATGPCQLAAGVVAHVDLRLGDQVAEVLEAHLVAGQGKLRGVRQHATNTSGDIGRYVFNAPEHLLEDSKFRRGFGHLQRHRLSFDVSLFHTQLNELADLADAFPETLIVLNHAGMALGVAEYRSRRTEVQTAWSRDMRALAKRPNVNLKIGGLGMPLLGHGFERGPCPASSAQLAQAWQATVDVCIDAFGPQRCMFESNFPVDKQSCTYAALWNAFKLATQALSREDRMALFYKTACRTYRLEQLEALGDAA